MKMYSKNEIDRVKRDADIRRIIPGAKATKATQEVECPFCGKRKFYVDARRGHNNARCWVCEQGFGNPVEAYAHYNGLDIKRDYVACVEGAASECGIVITPEEALRESFCAQQLAGSGLTVDDVWASVVENEQELTVSPFRPGRVGAGFIPESGGDDMLIYYYDLQGRPMQYTVKGTRRPRN